MEYISDTATISSDSDYWQELKSSALARYPVNYQFGRTTGLTATISRSMLLRSRSWVT